MTALLRSLPKQLRRGLVPIPDRVREVLPHIDPGEPLLPALERELRRAAAVHDPARTPGRRTRCPTTCGRPSACSTTRQRPLAIGKDLEALRRRSRRRRGRAWRGPPSTSSGPGSPTWAFGTLPRTVEVQRGAHVVTAYPALVDEGQTVGVRVVPTEAEAGRLTWLGARRLLVLVAGSPARQVVKALSPSARLALQFNPDGEIPDLVADCVDAAADELIAAAGGPPRDEAAFTALVATAKEQLLPLTADAVRRVEAVLDPGPGGRRSRSVRRRVAGYPRRRSPTCAARWAGCCTAASCATAGRRRLPDVVRYLRAMAHRLEKLPANAVRDELWMAQVAAVTAEYEQLRAQVPAQRRPRRPGARVRWMIEELRVGLFAQAVGTPRPVSEQRVYKAIDQLIA